MKYKTIIIGLALLTLLFPDLSIAAQYHNEEALQQKAKEIYGLIMCPLCAGQTIAQSSNETSTQMRDLVLKKLSQGETKEEILQYFESRYGERILAKPNKKGVQPDIMDFSIRIRRPCGNRYIFSDSSLVDNGKTDTGRPSR